MKSIFIKQWKSPAGELILGSFEEHLCLCDWIESEHRSTNDHRLQRMLRAVYKTEASPTIDLAIKQLEYYFEGRLEQFNLPLRFVGTPFQISVWEELLKIPYGKTISYATLAERVGNFNAARAVASANAANTISIIVPCHRVIGSSGRLVGYAGGLPAKQYLLDLEKQHKQ